MSGAQDSRRREAEAVAATFEEMRGAGVASSAEERGRFLVRVYGHLLAAIVAFTLFEVYLFKAGLARPLADKLMGNSWLLVLGGFTGLTLIVFQTRKDFSFLGGLLRWAGILALLGIVGAVIFGWELGTWFSLGMIALAGGAILYDTSNIIRYWPNDRYVGAALELFASVALMFWYILRLFMSRR